MQNDDAFLLPLFMDTIGIQQSRRPYLKRKNSMSDGNVNRMPSVHILTINAQEGELCVFSHPSFKHIPCRCNMLGSAKLERTPYFHPSIPQHRTYFDFVMVIRCNLGDLKIQRLIKGILLTLHSHLKKKKEKENQHSDNICTC